MRLPATLLALPLLAACAEQPPSQTNDWSELKTASAGGSSGSSGGASGLGGTASSSSGSGGAVTGSSTAGSGGETTSGGATNSGSGGSSNNGSGGSSSGGSSGNGSSTGGSGNGSGGGTSAGSGGASGGSGGSGGTTGGSGGTTGSGGSGTTGGSGGTGGTVEVENPLTDPTDGPAAGNPDGGCAIPAEAGLEDISSPDRVVGDGSPESCTGDAVVAAVGAGGVITFDCGPDPVTIMMTEPAQVYNDASEQVVIDGGGLVTLSGSGQTRILYMNTCDSDLVWTTSHCQNQQFPELTVQNITFVDGNSKGESNEDERGGGGAIWAGGGRFKAVNARFFNNVCADTGPDVGGAVRVFNQYQDQPAYIVNTTFGGADGFGNSCSNGGGISSIHVSWTVLNSVFSYNRAVGNGGNPAEDGTPGGGSGGAIYNDGQTMTLNVCGSLLEHNEVNAYGSAIFFVSNNHDGTLVIDDSTIRDNTGGGWNVLPSISMHEDTERIITNSTIE